MSRTGGHTLTAYRIGAVALILAGALGLLYGQQRITADTHTATIGDVGITVREVRDHRTMNLPLWASVGAMVAGAAVLFTLGRGTRQ
jgi:hypothetical protein